MAGHPYNSYTGHAKHFDALEKMQGARGTYFAGELPNFSTVGLSAEYAEYAEELVERFF